MKDFTRLSALMLGLAILTLNAGVAIAQDEKPAAEAKAEAKPAVATETETKNQEPASPAAKATARGHSASGAEKLLADKGLTKDHKRFLLDETAAIDKFDESKMLYTKYQDAVMKFTTIVDYDENLAALNTQWQTMQQQANTLQQQINNQSGTAGRYRGLVNANLAPLRQQHAQLVAQANQMKAQFTTMQKQAPKSADREKVSAEVDKARQAYVTAVGELEKLVTPLMAKYHEIATDQTVIEALVEIRQKTSVTYKVGPTDELRAAAKVIKDLKMNTAGPARTKAAKKKAATKGSL